MDQIKAKVAEVTPDIIRDLEKLVSYPSYYQTDAAPFGKAAADCLEAALQMGRDYGFKAVDLDHYAGYIEMGRGDEVIGVVGHLDVVPVSDSWQTDPFVLTRQGDRLYGRGTSDDKGGVLCSLAAMRIIRDLGVPLNRRIRLIMGCNEESGSAGLRYYLQKEGAVDMGFTPDGSFPVVFGEKGMIHGAFCGHTDKIMAIAGGTAFNAVPAKVTMELTPGQFDEQAFTAFITGHQLTVSIEHQPDRDKVTVLGVSAHASTPELGRNAISYAMEGLYQAGFDDPFTTAYHEKIGLGYYGEGLGVDVSDQYGRLTMNLGVAEKRGDAVVVSVDIRFPVTMKHQPLEAALAENGGGHIQELNGVDPLFFPLDSPMIKALLDAYYGVTHSALKPFTMGGGTYARTMPNIVAFGCDTQEYNWHIHDDNEFVTIGSLQTQTEVYAHALLNLLAL